MGKDDDDVTPSDAWRPITDYESSPKDLARSELRELSAIWNEQKAGMESASGLLSFNEKLKREWAIETGLLERIYTLDRGITQLLIERGIDASLIPHKSTDKNPSKLAAILKDHENAIDSLFAFVKGERQLSTSYIKELHALLTSNQETTVAVDQFGRTYDVPLIKGDYKRLPNNPKLANGEIHEYCPPEHTAMEMDRLIALHLAHNDVEPEVEAAWLHHRFTQIHPFQDGNGRVARCLATLVFVRRNWFPLVIRDTERERAQYLDALEAADDGELLPLVSVFASFQKRAFIQALGISQQILKLTKAEQVIRAAREELEDRERRRIREWEQAKVTARILQEFAYLRAKQIAVELGNETGPYLDKAEFFVDAEPNDGLRSHYFRWQIIETAKVLQYYVNHREYRSWIRLVLKWQTQTEILISFHGSGYEFRGILACSACFFRRDESEEGERDIVDLTPLSSDIFQINYLERIDDAELRFKDWMEEILVKGLELWRRGL